jgi:hypothetical protein
MTTEPTPINTVITKIDIKTKIDILLKEYDVLTTHIVERINHRWSITGYLCAAIGAIAAFSKFEERSTQLILLAIAVLLLIMWQRSWSHIQRVAARVAEIENQVNHLAGEKLLVWENRETSKRRDLGI